MAENKKTKDKKKESVGVVFKKNWYLMKLVWKVCPARVVWAFINPAAQYFYSILTGIIFLETIVGFLEKGSAFSETIPFLTGMVVALMAIRTLLLYGWDVAEAVQTQKMYESLHINMLSKAGDVELECFENPEFYNNYMKATSRIKSCAHTLMWTLPRLITGIFAIFYLGYKTVKIDRFAILFALLPLISTYVIGNRINKLKYSLYQDNVGNWRICDYVKRTVYQAEYAKELRLSNGFSMLIYYFQDGLNEVIKNTKKYGWKIGLLNGLSGSMSKALIAAGSIVYASVRLLFFEDITPSAYLVLINAIGQISSTLTQSAFLLSKLQDNSLYIDNIRGFMEYEPKISGSQSGKNVNKEDILLKMENVGFSYFGSEKQVLKDINISIHKGEKIALVGENGAGKSTLVKLLMRLYDPTEGKVTLNGEDVKEYAVEEYRNLFGTVFQDCKVFSLTVAENVVMREVKEEDRERIEEALKNSGVYEKVQSLPKGMDTMLTRSFDPEGAVLSGGENQKIAIARVFAKDCEIAILDEPSSALDPIAEYEMYENMLNACKDKAVIFISHRLSSAVMADKIYLLENGEVAECGSHKELMKKGGKYAEMFHIQAKNYVGEVS